jgi:hypothetical protein
MFVQKKSKGIEEEFISLVCARVLKRKLKDKS